MSTSSSLWTNPLTLILSLLGLIWLFTVVKFCKAAPVIDPTTTETAEPPSPIPGYHLLPEMLCPLKLSAADEELAVALLQQYFRMDTLNRFQEAIWRPDKRLDPVFVKIYEGNWETYVECIQTLSRDSSGIEEKIAIIASNFADNDCHTCAPYIGYIRFNMRQDDPATAVIRGSDRALFTFGAYGAIGDQISLVKLGDMQALAFSTASTGQGHTLGNTTLYNVEDFRPILTVESYESNGGSEETDLFERKGDLYVKEAAAGALPPDLALYQSATVLNGDPAKVPVPETLYFQYQADSLRYVKVQ